MKRGGYIQRKTPLRARGKSRYAQRPRLYDYMGFVRELPCRVAVVLGTWKFCGGRVEADHAGERPFGRKCPDDETIPLCRAHHRERPAGAGHFFGDKERFPDRTDRRVWLDDQIAEVRSLYLSHQGKL